MKTLIFILSVIVLLFLNSCAAILQGSKQNVSVTTEPSTAKIYVDDEYVGTGHAQARLRRNKQHTIMAKDDLYQTRYITIDTHLQAGWLVADVFFGFLPLIIDAATGSWNAFDKDHYIIQLDKK